MSSKFIFWQDKPTNCIVFVLLLYIVISYSAAVNRVSYKEDATITPKRYKDKFMYKKEFKTVSTNGSSEVKDHFRAKGGSSYKNCKEGELPRFSHRAKSVKPGEPTFLDSVKPIRPGEPKFSDRVKSVSPGEKTMRQSDDDDDDDDDGGEYEGLSESGNLPGETQTEYGKKDPVPVMIIRQLDMVAMGIPMKDSSRDKDRYRDRSGECYEAAQGLWKGSGRKREQTGLGGGSGFLDTL